MPDDCAAYERGPSRPAADVTRLSGLGTPHWRQLHRIIFSAVERAHAREGSLARLRLGSPIDPDLQGNAMVRADLLQSGVDRVQDRWAAANRIASETTSLSWLS
jgi:hypothetical protein